MHVPWAEQAYPLQVDASVHVTGAAPPLPPVAVAPPVFAPPLDMPPTLLPPWDAPPLLAPPVLVPPVVVPPPVLVPPDELAAVPPLAVEPALPPLVLLVVLAPEEHARANGIARSTQGRIFIVAMITR